MKILKWINRFGVISSYMFQKDTIAFLLDQDGTDYCTLECASDGVPIFSFTFKEGMSKTECSKVVDDLHKFLCEEGSGIKDLTDFAFRAPTPIKGITQKDIDEMPLSYLCKYSKDNMIYAENNLPTEEEADKDIETMASDGFELQEIWKVKRLYLSLSRRKILYGGQNDYN